MKTENTIDNKKAFFAQYWGQRISCYQPHDENYAYEIGGTELSVINENHYLSLKDFSTVTDEDKLEIFNLGYPIYINYEVEEKLEVWKLIEFNEVRMGADLLRAKGYAVPWRNLTVYDLIEYGWVKIKTNGKS